MNTDYFIWNVEDTDNLVVVPTERGNAVLDLLEDVAQKYGLDVSDLFIDIAAIEQARSEISEAVPEFDWNTQDDLFDE